MNIFQKPCCGGSLPRLLAILATSQFRCCCCTSNFSARFAALFVPSTGEKGAKTMHC